MSRSQSDEPRTLRAFAAFSAQIPVSRIVSSETTVIVETQQGAYLLLVYLLMVWTLDTPSLLSPPFISPYRSLSVAPHHVSLWAGVAASL